MELRQLRYFVTLTEELHFGLAASRENIVQSALSQQLQRLERELGVRLLERTTHKVQLTPAGSAFLVEARQILAHVDRAAVAARRAAGSAPTLRVGIVDASYDSMPQILRGVRERYPDMEIHEVEVGVPQQFSMLVGGRLDVGLGRASLAPSEVAAELFRLDPLGVLVPEDHRLAALPGVPVATLATEPLLLAEERRAPEFNQFGSSCAARWALCRRCTAGAWKASGRRPTWSGRDAASCAPPPRADRRFPGSCGGRWSSRCPVIPGPCCGGPMNAPSTYVGSSRRLAGSHGSWAGCNRPVRQLGEPRPAV